MNRRAALRSLLAAYEPEDPAERAYLARMRDLAADPDPFSRDAFTPGHFTASAFVLHPDRPALLLVQHRKLGRWLQPGGHIDPADPGPREAAARETGEETGILLMQPLGEGLFDVDVHLFPGREGGESIHEHFDLRFLFRSGMEDPVPGVEVGEVRWMAFDEIAEHDTDRSLLRPAGKALGDLS